MKAFQRAVIWLALALLAPGLFGQTAKGGSWVQGGLVTPAGVSSASKILKPYMPFLGGGSFEAGSVTFLDPRNLGNMAAWYDSSDANSLIYNSSNQVALWSDKSGNSGTGTSQSTGLYLTGAATDYASAPNAAALQITGDIDLRIYGASNSWVSANLQMLISKNTSGAGQWAYDCYVNTSGNLVFRYSPDGTTLRTATSSVALSTPNRTATWMRCTYATASGNVIFYTSADGSNWTQLGTTQVVTSGTIFAGTNSLSIGANSGGGLNLFSGAIYRAQIYNGINGTLAFDANFVGQRTNATTFTESSSNAATVTINGTALLGWVDAANVLCLDGNAGNYASSPSAAPVKITGSIDLRADAALVNWATGSNQGLISKVDGTSSCSYDMFISAAGRVVFRYTPDGTVASLRTATSSVNPSVSALGRLSVRATYNSATGDVTFYTASDFASWVQLGTVQTLTAAAIFDGNNAIAIGAGSGGAAPRTAGIFYRAQIYNGIAGTLAFDANFATAAKLATSFTESSSNAATVTINTSGATGARISGARDLYQGTAANQPILTIAAGGNYVTFDGSNDYLKAAAFSLSQPETVYFVGSQISNTVSDSLIDGQAATSTLRISQTGTGSEIVATAGTSLGPISTGLNTPSVVTAVFNSTSSSIRNNRAAATVGNAGTGTPNGVVLGAQTTPGNYANITASEIAIYSVAHDASTQDSMAIYENIKWVLGF